MDNVPATRRRVLAAGIGLFTIPASSSAQSDSGAASIGNALDVGKNHFNSVGYVLHEVLKKSPPFSESGLLSLVQSLASDSVLDPKEGDIIGTMVKSIFHATEKKQILDAINTAQQSVQKSEKSVGKALAELARSSYEGVYKFLNDPEMAVYRYTIVRDIAGGGMAVRGVSKITSAWQARVAAVLSGGIATSVAAYYVCDK